MSEVVSSAALTQHSPTPLTATPERRPLSGIERVWLAFGRAQPPFAIQWVVEGPKNGPAPDPEQFAQAAQRQCATHPGTRLRLVGHLAASFWQADGPAPAVRVVDGSAWNGESEAGADFLNAPFDVRHGPTAEILLVSGERWRVVFRTPHAVMDGIGVCLWARDFFAHLRGETPAFVTGGRPHDAAVARSLQKGKPRWVQERAHRALTGDATAASEGVAWRRVRVDGPLTSALARTAVALLEAAPEPPEPDRMQLSIPVDMRKLGRVGASTANLTGIMWLDAKALLGADDPIATFDRELLHGLMQRRFAQGVVAAEWTRIIPLWTLSTFTRARTPKIRRKNAFPTLGVLSHIGTTDLSALRGAGFEAERAFFVSPSAPSGSLFLTMNESRKGSEQALELCATMPRCFASNDRLTALMDGVAERLRQNHSK
jgi:hypothetical protein